MVVAAIGRLVLGDLIKNHMKYLKALTSQLQAILAAPAEIKEMTRQVDALYVCLELLLEQVVAQDSIININASEDAGRIEKFLESCTKNLTIVDEIIRKHVRRLPDGRKTWSDTFRRMYQTYSWTLQKGNIADMVQSIKNDLEMVTKITSAIQRLAVNSPPLSVC
jgi:GTP1/Obg family GTP-binding protein